MALPPEKAGYTFADCLTWNEKERIEIIDGEVFLMAAPTSIHQEISMEISRQIANFLEGKRCRVYPAPFDVRLFENSCWRRHPSPHEIYEQEDVAKVNVLDGCFIELSKVFPE